MRDEFKTVEIGCSEIPVLVIEGVRKYCERVGFIASDETILAMARDEFDRKYLREDGTYEPDASQWRKIVRAQGYDPEEITREIYASWDTGLEDMKRDDPDRYAKIMRESQEIWDNFQRLTDARKTRYQELHKVVSISKSPFLV